MIASFKYNYIFIKPKKVGGTTVEVVLSASCGPEDIIAPLGRSDEIQRSAGGPLICRNFADPHLEKLWREAIVRDDFSAFDSEKRRRRAITFRAHMTASEIRDALDAGFWNNACKISVVRHPYEKAVSKAFYHYAPKRGAFDSFLDKTVRRGKYTSSESYMIDGESVIDEFLRLETLHHDLSRVGAKLGIPIPGELPRMKSKTRKDHRPAHEILTNEQKDIIFEFCKPEFELLNYER